MTDPTGFSPTLVPGFEFMQNLVKSAGSALPGIGQWVAPTIDPEEIAKRIEELRTVQFWLEQNARMIGATIQAMEVQRMTLTTLKTMNVRMEDLRESMKITMPGMAPAAAAPSSSASAASSAASASTVPPAGGSAPASSTPAGVVDPMQWWGALTRQFTELAATAMKDNGSEAARALAPGAAGSAPAGASSADPAPAAVDAVSKSTKPVTTAKKSASER